MPSVANRWIEIVGGGHGHGPWIPFPCLYSLHLWGVRFPFVWLCLESGKGLGMPLLGVFHLCTPSVEKLGRRHMAWLIALLSNMPSIFVSCLRLNTPRCVAWYLDFSCCSIARVFRGGLSLRFARVLASFLTSVVMWWKCSLKSRNWCGPRAICMICWVVDI